MHDFPRDFYGFELRALVLGYIRPQFDYDSQGDTCLTCYAGLDKLNRVSRGTN